jgi:lysozyme
MKKVNSILLLSLAGLALTLQSQNAIANDNIDNNNESNDMYSKNLNAFLKTIRICEGTDKSANPYAVVYAYQFTITDFSNHPANLGWGGVKLSEKMCNAAGFGAGCVSTAAGAYQIIKPTWNGLNMPNFSSQSQDKAAIKLINQVGALADIEAGRVEIAIKKCSKLWASLPGNTYQQNAKSMASVLSYFVNSGGTA